MAERRIFHLLIKVFFFKNKKIKLKFYHAYYFELVKNDKIGIRIIYQIKNYFFISEIKHEIKWNIHMSIARHQFIRSLFIIIYVMMSHIQSTK